MKVGEWWSKMFGRSGVEWRAFEIESHCTSSDDGERCCQPGEFVLAFRSRGALGISTVCRRHYDKFSDEADAHECEPQPNEMLKRLPFLEVKR